eukprot:593211-Ditylum_brightwellii.AAC.1
MEFVLIMAFASWFKWIPHLQWWFVIIMIKLFCQFTAWQHHILLLVSYRYVVVMEKMDKALFNQHAKHFSHAEIDGTPFKQKPLKALGQYVKTAMGQAFCTCTSPLHNLPIDQYTLEFLKELKHNHADQPDIKTDIRNKMVRDNYKNWKEKTSTSPEGRCLSLYKTWINVPEEKVDKYEGLSSDEFFYVITMVMNVCRCHNIPLPRWLTVHNL